MLKNTTIANKRRTCRMYEISVIIPVRNESGNIDELNLRLKKAISGISKNYEIIFVTDINNDNTYEQLVKKNREDKRVKILKFTNSHGQHVAIIAGLQNCSGKYAVIMDGDLQACPEDIPALYSKIKEGYGLVYAKKKQKNTNIIRNQFSKMFNWLMESLSEVKSDIN